VRSVLKSDSDLGARRSQVRSSPRTTDTVMLFRHVRFVPTTDIIGALDTVNSLYEEPFFSCRQGGGSAPPAATGTPSPTRAVSEQHLHAVLSLVRRTGRRSSVPLASRPSGNRFGRFPTNVARGVPGWLVVPRGSSLSHSCHLKLCICGKLFQILILLPFLHSPRRFCCRGYPTSLSCGHSANCGRPLLPPWASWTRFDLDEIIRTCWTLGLERRTKFVLTHLATTTN
jgi:hypothetical protein